MQCIDERSLSSLSDDFSLKTSIDINTNDVAAGATAAATAAVVAAAAALRGREVIRKPRRETWADHRVLCDGSSVNMCVMYRKTKKKRSCCCCCCLFGVCVGLCFHPLSTPEGGGGGG